MGKGVAWLYSDLNVMKGRKFEWRNGTIQCGINVAYQEGGFNEGQCPELQSIVSMIWIDKIRDGRNDSKGDATCVLRENMTHEAEPRYNIWLRHPRRYCKWLLSGTPQDLHHRFFTDKCNVRP